MTNAHGDLKVSATLNSASRYFRDTPWRVSTPTLIFYFHLSQTALEILDPARGRITYVGQECPGYPSDRASTRLAPTI